MVDIAGKPMIQRVYEQCSKANSLNKVIVATDDVRIFEVVKQFGGHAVMTSQHHLNGTSRCAEVIEQETNFDFAINIQGDEPFIHPKQIDDLAFLFKDSEAQIITQVKKETNISLLQNPNIVKAILNNDSFAVDFKRTIQQSTDNIPYFYKHIGIYGFKTTVLKEIVHLTPTTNELQQHLEQLRWLDNNYKIKVGITTYESISIDIQEDLEKVRKTLNF